MTIYCRKVIAEFTEDGWLTMDEAGNVRRFETPEKVWGWVQRADKRRKGTVVTLLEWRNAPEGFTLPGE
jgi:hypothetical protein